MYYLDMISLTQKLEIDFSLLGGGGLLGVDLLVSLLGGLLGGGLLGSLLADLLGASSLLGVDLLGVGSGSSSSFAGYITMSLVV